MADHTNMDLNKEDAKNGPQLEFSLPLAEVDEDLEVGDRGKVVIPAEVTEITKTHVFFRKTGAAESAGAFQTESLDDMEDRINARAKDDEGE